METKTMNKDTIIRRCLCTPTELHVREAAEGEAPSRTITGYAILFNVPSAPLWSDEDSEAREVIAPEAVTKELLDGQDIKMTMFHNRQLILARSNKGGGTLSYTVDEKGVAFEFDAPNTVDGDKALELVSRGDIAGCSFIYSTDEGDSENAVSYERLDEKGDDGEDILLRHVKRIDNVYDFTITTDPAYEQTDVSKREVEAAGIKFEQQPKPKQIDESKKRERINEVRERIASVGRNL